jgi:hypothetical protein
MIMRRSTIPALIAAAIVGAALIATAAGCAAPRKDRTSLLKGIPTKQVHLAPTHTGAPEIVMTVPAQYAVDWTEEARYDNFLIFDPQDTGVVQRGMIAVNITPKPVQHVEDSVKGTYSIGSISGNDLKWRETTDPGFDDVPVYQREATQKELLKTYPSPDKNGPLVVHVFIVGSDPKLVELLMGAVETMKILPGKPNV